MTNIDAQRIKEIRNNTKEMTYYIKSIAKSFERIADALESTVDTPQRDCYMCKWLGKVDVCGRCRNRNLFAEADTEPKPKTEPQTDYKKWDTPPKVELPTINTTCIGVAMALAEDEPQTERHLPDYSYEADLGRRIMEQTQGRK